MRISTKKPWVLVHFTNEAVKPGLGLCAAGFAIFSAENWRRYRDGLPKGIPLTSVLWRDQTKKRYLQRLHIVHLSDFVFHQICKNVLNVSPVVLQLRLGQMREGDCRPVAKYGYFPEYEFPSN